MFAREASVLRRVIDDQIHHHPDPSRAGRFNKPSQQIVIRLCAGAPKNRIEPVIILNRVEASGEAGRVERIHVDPIETHRGYSVEMFAPSVDRADEPREKIIDPRTRRHHQCALTRPGTGIRPLAASPAGNGY